MERLVPWASCLAILALRYRTSLLTHLPAYGDALEVVWGFAWYHQALAQGVGPFFTHLVFHPVGWHIGSFGYTPTLLLSGVPFYALGGGAFAYNSLALLSFLVAFAGSLRLARLYVSGLPAIMAALVYTFVGYRWVRLSGHLNILWLTASLPWLIASLETLRRSDDTRLVSRRALVSGLLWGAMINCALYGVFVGLIGLTVWGRALLTWARLRQALVIGMVALLVGAPVMLAYLFASRANNFPPPPLLGAYEWGASLNSLVAPAYFHPFEPVRQLSHRLYPGPFNESGVMNLGGVSFVLGGLGVLTLWRRRQHWGPFWLALVGLGLALGMILRWNGQPMSHPLFAPLDSLIWQLGWTLKPGLFSTAAPTPPFDTGVPLPGLVLSAVVPFWEAGRSMARYAFVGGLGLFLLAAIGLQRLPRLLQLTLALVWLVEIWPYATANEVMPTRSHPAYEWVAGQGLDPEEGILDLAYPSGIMTGGEVIYAAWLNGTPTASGVGSFWPRQTFALQDTLAQGQGLTRPETAGVLRQQHIQYLLVHLRTGQDRDLWTAIQSNSRLTPVNCFEPFPDRSPWVYPICVARVRG